MIIYRIPGQSTSIDVSVPVLAGTQLHVVIESTEDNAPYVLLSAYTATAGDYVLSVDLKQYMSYDCDLTVSVFEDDGNQLAEIAVSIVRPYSVPDDSLTEEEKKLFWKQEQISRFIIDSITGGFYSKRKLIEYESYGGDALPMRGGVTRLYRAWVNGVQIPETDTDWFKISPDGSSIIIKNGNISHGRDTSPRMNPSDYMSTGGLGWYRRGSFPESYDYVFDVSYGYRNVPQEIALASQLLIESGQCTDEYLNRYIAEYSTDQYKIKYNAAAFVSTGNRQVDMILSGFVKASGNINARVI